MRSGSIFAVGLLVLPIFAQDPAGFQEMVPQQRTVIDKGIRWLLDIQNRGGGWGCEKSGAPSTAITALAALSLMAGGSTSNGGPHRDRIAQALEFCIKRQHSSGLITQFDATGMGPFYDHSCASFFLAEVYGMARHPEAKEESPVKRALLKAIEYMDKTQNRDGGWTANGASGASDLGITCSVWMALRSAHNAGITIGDANMERVLKFVDACSERTGGFSQYPRVAGGGGKMFYPTAAGLRILYGVGKGDLKAVVAGTEFLLKHQLGREYGGKISEWDYCGAFYAVQALLHEGGKYWKEWYPKIREHLLKIQNTDGSWTIEYCMCCRAYATALALLVLQAPQRLLPLFQL